MEWIPELGLLVLLAGLAAAVLQAVLPWAGLTGRRPLWIAMAEPMVRLQSGCVVVAYALLAYCFAANDFSVAFVAAHSNSALPLYYRLCAVWGGHEGSMLLWMLMLVLWELAVCYLARSLPSVLKARVLAVMGLISAAFLAFIIGTSNPFARALLPVPKEGADLNPLLQDIGLIIHPPMLYMGYVGFSVAFAFAIAALWSGQQDAAWTRWVRPWTNTAWAFLTMGIVLGSWWAYYELGWGGWWFWDPVENASLMPWLTGCALVHSLAATEKRGLFKRWTLLLALCTFSLSLLGTFLVRSGVLTSVHAFTSDPSRGSVILVLLLFTVGGSLLLYGLRAPRMASQVVFGVLSRDLFLLLNTAVMMLLMLAVLLGTLYPIALESLGLGHISVGPPYFNAIFVPLGVVLCAAMGWGPLLRWKTMSAALLWCRARWLLGLAVVLGGALGWRETQHFTVSVELAAVLAAWVTLPLLRDVAVSVLHAASIKGVTRLSRRYYGMMLGHVGLAFVVLGIAIVSAGSVERDVRMVRGVSVNVGGYDVMLTGVRRQGGPNYDADVATLRVTCAGQLITHLYPEKRYFPSTGQVVTETALDGRLKRDLYVAMGETTDNGSSWSMRIQIKPRVRWIWLGGILIAAGALTAAMDKRYRLYQRATKRENGTPPSLSERASSSEPAASREVPL